MTWADALVWMGDNKVFGIFLIVVGVIAIKELWKKYKKAKKERETPLPPTPKPEGSKYNGMNTFDTAYLDTGLSDTNFLETDKLSYLKSRRQKVVEELKDNIHLLKNAKKRHREILDIGKALRHVLDVLKEDLNNYDEKIKREENDRKEI